MVKESPPPLFQIDQKNCIKSDSWAAGEGGLDQKYGGFFLGRGPGHNAAVILEYLRYSYYDVKNNIFCTGVTP